MTGFERLVTCFVIGTVGAVLIFLLALLAGATLDVAFIWSSETFLLLFFPLLLISLIAWFVDEELPARKAHATLLASDDNEPAAPSTRIS